MRSTQKTKLGSLSQTNGWALVWHDAVDSIPHDDSKFTLILAHEFFDALPFHLLQVREAISPLSIFKSHAFPVENT